jgi:hypothetical protein
MPCKINNLVENIRNKLEEDEQAARDLHEPIPSRLSKNIALKIAEIASSQNLPTDTKCGAFLETTGGISLVIQSKNRRVNFRISYEGEINVIHVSRDLTKTEPIHFTDHSAIQRIILWVIEDDLQNCERRC